MATSSPSCKQKKEVSFVVMSGDTRITLRCACERHCNFDIQKHFANNINMDVKITYDLSNKVDNLRSLRFNSCHNVGRLFLLNLYESACNFKLKYYAKTHLIGMLQNNKPSNFYVYTQLFLNKQENYQTEIFIIKKRF